jgi:hypothetical protein
MSTSATTIAHDYRTVLRSSPKCDKSLKCSCSRMKPLRVRSAHSGVQMTFTLAGLTSDSLSTARVRVLPR